MSHRLPMLRLHSILHVSFFVLIFIHRQIKYNVTKPKSLRVPLQFSVLLLCSIVVKTIIFIRHACNLWNIFNSSLIPPTRLYHAKTLPFLLLKYCEIFSCLTAKRHNKKKTVGVNNYSFSLCYRVRSVNLFKMQRSLCPFAPLPLLFNCLSDLVLKLLYPLTSKMWIKSSKGRICYPAFLLFNLWTGN